MLWTKYGLYFGEKKDTAITYIKMNKNNFLGLYLPPKPLSICYGFRCTSKIYIFISQISSSQIQDIPTYVLRHRFHTLNILKCLPMTERLLITSNKGCQTNIFHKSELFQNIQAFSHVGRWLMMIQNFQLQNQNPKSHSHLN